jgi:deazaflavin-dependent oxidoreductase (nitroreductase family)
MESRSHRERTLGAVRDWDTLNAAVIAEFRVNDGRVTMVGDHSVVIVHTIGARSGAVRQIPLIPVFEGDGMFLLAAAAGAPSHPGWYHNLRAHPRVTIEYGPERFTAEVVQLPDDRAE